tara:strand:- start:14309 stop:15649 length:1341 start_codon:yes stop_codon:yes gene_type:complete
MKLRINILALFVILCLGAFAQQTENDEQLSFTLQEAKAYAAKHSYSTQQAVMDEEIARKKVKETTAIGLPQVSASGQFQQYIDIPTQVIPNFLGDSPEYLEAKFGTEFNINGGISASQLLFDGSYLVGLKAAKVYREMASNQVVKSEQEIQKEVAYSYALVLVSERNIEILKGSKSNIDSMLFETEQLYKEGFTEEQNVDQLRLTASEITNQLNNAERQTEVARNLLKFQMGIEVAKTIELTNELEEVLTTAEQETLLTQTLDINTHIDYKIALTNEELQRLNMRNEKAGFLPKLSAFYNYQQSYMSDELDVTSDFWFPTNVWGINLEVPIFTSFQRRFKVQQTQIDYEKAQLQTEQASQSLQLGVLQAKADYNQALSSYEVKKGNYELAKKIFDKESIKFQEGVSSSLDFTQAQNQMLESQSNYLMAILTLVESKTNLDNALNNY